MHILFVISAYLVAALSLLSAGLIGVSLLTAPSASSAANPSRFQERTVSNEKTQILVRPDGKAFRYGPEVNHGRSDTPINASSQALREARTTTKPQNRPRRDQERVAQDAGVATTFGRGLSSGH